jgi:hypothetical protein
MASRLGLAKPRGSTWNCAGVLADLLALSADERLALSADEIAAHPRLRRFVTEKQNQQTLAMARGFSANCLD